MKLSRLLISGVLLAGLLQSPQNARAEDKVATVQRDLYDLAHKVELFQKSQDEKIAALTALLQQVVDTNTQTAQSLAGLRQSLADNLKLMNAQQGQMAAPMAELGVKIDRMSQEFTSVSQSIQALGTRFTRFDDKLNDISASVRTLSAPPAAPPPSAVVGPSAEALYGSARNDYTSGNDKLALDEFINYLQLFPKSDNAPRAQYYMGALYGRLGQPEDAIKAYDAVLERYPEGQWTRDAAYEKGVALMNSGKKDQAIRQFKDFVAQFPGEERIGRVNEFRRQLEAPPPRNNTKKGRP